MCFGMEATKNTNGTQLSTTNNTATKTNQVNPYVESAANSNLTYASGVRDRGFTPYTAPLVADPHLLEEMARHRATEIAGDGTGGTAQSLIGGYATAGPQSVAGGGTIASRMSPYMSQYVEAAMKPTLHQMDIANANSNKRVDAQATSAGAFGDARQGVESANNTFNQDVLRSGMVAQAYDKAFQTAIGAGAQDVANDINVQNMNANYGEIALNRALGGSSALQALQNQQLGVQGIINQYGGQETARGQAGLTAQYNQWLMGQQYPFQTTGLVNSTLGAGATALPYGSTMTTNGTTGAVTTGVTEQPNNAGWGMLGTAIGAFI